MKSNLFDHTENDNIIYNLSGSAKLICFMLLTFGVMYSFDPRVVGVILVFSCAILKLSGIKLSQIRVMIYYVIVFILMNFILTFLFAPYYGVELYGTRTELFAISSRYIVTSEQMFYQFTKFLKYVAVIPLGMIFLFTTNPSEFAASLNRARLPYKGTYAVSLTLRYFPDMIRNYTEISQAQQSRGLDMGKKTKVMENIKNLMNICLPLIFSTLDKIELISNAMDLRGFGKNKKRTWYSSKRIGKGDVLAVLICLVQFIGVFAVAILLNAGRFYNPFL